MGSQDKKDLMIAMNQMVENKKGSIVLYKRYHKDELSGEKNKWRPYAAYVHSKRLSKFCNKTFGHNGYFKHVNLEGVIELR